MLEAAQAAIAAALREGPAHLPTDLFAGEWTDALRAMTVHANTTSHARLTALEDIFPRTRAYLGEGDFNRLSRDFVDRAGAKGLAPARIGQGLADFLERAGAVLSADVARTEWLWLESYHAADAAALTLSDLAAFDEGGLLALPVRRHPAARVVTLASGAASIVDPDLPAAATALLITRPEAAVRLFPATPPEVAALALADEIVALGNLIGLLAEQHPEGGGAVVPLIAAGAFERV